MKLLELKPNVGITLGFEGKTFDEIMNKLEEHFDNMLLPIKEIKTDKDVHEYIEWAMSDYQINWWGSINGHFNKIAEFDFGNNTIEFFNGAVWDEDGETIDADWLVTDLDGNIISYEE